MKGDKQVIDALNECLMAELTGINIYYIHYMMQEDWGYKKIASHSKDESMGEMKHAHKIIERIISSMEFQTWLSMMRFWLETPLKPS